jgi:predicted membrane-bound spermidine synthase
MPSAPHSTARLRLVVLLGGTATMALQMAAVRLLAPAVGASSIVWATIIGLSLLAMSLGYVLGGRLADRRTDGATLARTLAAAAVLVALIPLDSPFVLDALAVQLESPAWSDLLGAGLTYTALVLAPAVLLGVTPPYAIRLAIPRVEDAGRTAGGLYALSTVGSIIGTLLTALVLVQWIGTRATLLAIAALLVVAALLARSVGRATSDAAAASREAAPGPGTDTRARVEVAARVVLPMSLAATIVLVEGMAMMATEMAIARLVAPFFGASHAVWAIIIATVMGSIALGSRIGGRRADRTPTQGALVVVLALAALAVAVLPFVTSPVMRLSTGGIDSVAVGTVVGTFVATMALLVVPVALLGMVPPFALRLAVPDVAHAGRTAGRMYALSTAGALVGTFASVLWLIPAIGTRRTMLLFAGALALLVVGLVASNVTDSGRTERVLAVVAPLVVVALAFAPTGLVKPLEEGEVLDERESRYQFIQVVRDGDRHLLQLNEGWAVHSIWERDTVLTGGIWDHFLVVPSLAGTGPCTDTGRAGAGAASASVCAALPDSATSRDMLVIGSAAGTTRRAFAQLRPAIDMTSVELDGEVTEVGREHFELEGEVERSDGRPFLERTSDRWNVIHVDAYRQPYIPFYLTTREFFELARSRLSPDGVVSINVGSSPDDQRINEAVAATMRDVFPFVARYRAEEYNEVIVASDDPDMTIERARAQLRASDLATPPLVVDREQRELARLTEAFAEGMVEVDPESDAVLTDDRAAVEWMTDRMIFGEAG